MKRSNFKKRAKVKFLKSYDQENDWLDDSWHLISNKMINLDYYVVKSNKKTEMERKSS